MRLTLVLLMVLGGCASTDQRDRIRMLEAENRELRNQLAALRESVGDLDRPLGLEARVLEVSQAGSRTLVGISIGADDGINVGDVLHLRRGEAYVGRLVVEKVYRSQSIGALDGKFRGKAAPPQKGDVAYSAR